MEERVVYVAIKDKKIHLRYFNDLSEANDYHINASAGWIDDFNPDEYGKCFLHHCIQMNDEVTKEIIWLKSE